MDLEWIKDQGDYTETIVKEVEILRKRMNLSYEQMVKKIEGLQMKNKCLFKVAEVHKLNNKNIQRSYDNNERIKGNMKRNTENIRRLLEEMRSERRITLYMDTYGGMIGNDFISLWGDISEKEPIVPSKEIQPHSCL